MPRRCAGACTPRCATGALREPALQPLRSYLDGDDALKPWSLAGELADAFEKYQAWRRDWLLGWEAGDSPRDLAGGAVATRSPAARAHRARRIDDYLRALRRPAMRHAPQGLPSRLFAFAT